MCAHNDGYNRPDEGGQKCHHGCCVEGDLRCISNGSLSSVKIMQWIDSGNSGYAVVRVGVLWIFLFWKRGKRWF